MDFCVKIVLWYFIFEKVIWIWLLGINWIVWMFLKFNFFDNIWMMILDDFVVIMLWVWIIMVWGCFIGIVVKNDKNMKKMKKKFGLNWMGDYK